ncbi:CPBP family intramembrane glutamic endopeptidase [Pyrococcus abyssi]|uniref:Probable protease, caaX family n=1 Tax=Pyrococcus abyssi (strain GE5 / Orsay) TaxID=272844 RepID=Q9V1L9_PYRAB|nr:CPBP family intramembrane glutamic endopeptidase [Pyrococcus abyssi]CAB49330.1 Probable protease, caaX family [Pyrococcus abyssi GE5]CCE69788.1 TPA: hypothetical protein PAB0274 [Pyrococcus abyssi GE5]
MERGKAIVLSAIGIEIMTSSMVLLYKAMGWVPLGILTLLLLYLVIRKLGIQREELGLGGRLNLKVHVLLPLSFMLLNLTWILPFGVGLNTFGKPMKIVLLIYLVLLIKYLIFVALYEEILFRGLMQRGFELWKGPKFAIIATTILFTLGHTVVRFSLQPTFPNFWRLYNPFLASLVYSIYRWRLRRIEGLILAHGLGDFIDRILTVENADWLLGTFEGHVYMVLAYTLVMAVQGYAYMKIPNSEMMGGR